MQTILKDFDIFSSFLRPLRPQMLRLQPPLLPMPQLGATSDPLECSVEEFQWLNPPTLAHEFHWDSTMGQLGPTLEVSRFCSFRSSFNKKNVLIVGHNLRAYQGNSNNQMVNKSQKSMALNGTIFALLASFFWVLESFFVLLSGSCTVCIEFSCVVDVELLSIMDAKTVLIFHCRFNS